MRKAIAILLLAACASAPSSPSHQRMRISISEMLSGNRPAPFYGVHRITISVRNTSEDVITVERIHVALARESRGEIREATSSFGTTEIGPGVTKDFGMSVMVTPTIAAIVPLPTSNAAGAMTSGEPPVYIDSLLVTIRGKAPAGEFLETGVLSVSHVRQ